MLVKPCIILVTSKTFLELCTFGFSVLSLTNTETIKEQISMVIKKEANFLQTSLPSTQLILSCLSEVWVDFRVDVVYHVQKLFHHALLVLVVAAGEFLDGFRCLLFYFSREVTLGAHYLKSRSPLSKKGIVYDHVYCTSLYHLA